MRLHILLLVGCLLGARGMAIGAHGGVNFMNANVSGSNSDTGYLLGFHFDKVLVPELLSVRPELNLNRVGAENTSFGGAGTTRFTYLEVPIQLKFSLYTKAIEFFLLGGPKFAYLLNATAQGATLPVAATSRTEFGVYLGGGMGIIPKGLTRLHVIARLVIGLTDLDASSLEWRTNGLQLLVSVTF